MTAGEARLASGAEPARGRGRPRKDPADLAQPRRSKAAAVPAPDPAAVLGLEAMVSKGTRALADWRRCPAYAMGQEDATRTAVLLDACLKQYLPQIESAHANLMALSAVLAMHFTGAVVSERTLRKAEREAAKKAA